MSNATVGNPPVVVAVDGSEATLVATRWAARWNAPLRIVNGTAFTTSPPVWMFSSGPVGERQRPGEDPMDVAGHAAAVNARTHRLFGGKIDKGALRLVERAVVAALQVHEGDYRDWPTIHAWARHIGTELWKTRAGT